LAKKQTKISIDLALDDIKVKQVSTDKAGNYHIHAVCTAPLVRAHIVAGACIKLMGIARKVP